MKPKVRKFSFLPRLHSYRTSEPLILVNGLAEQAESWFANRVAWSRHFDVKIPEILVYNGAELRRHLDSGGEITVDYLVGRLSIFLDQFVQKPPYNLVGSSLGGQIILTYAARYPDKVSKLVFLCPSGMHGDENLPVIEGVRRSNYDLLVSSVFHNKRFANQELVDSIEAKFQDREWKKSVLRTLRGTIGHSVAHLLDSVPHPSLFIWGTEDKVIADVKGAIRAVDGMIASRQVVIPKCGHAPQIEKARLVNHLVSLFLRDQLKSIPPALEAARFLEPERDERHFGLFGPPVQKR